MTSSYELEKATARRVALVEEDALRSTYVVAEVGERAGEVDRAAATAPLPPPPSPHPRRERELARNKETALISRAPITRSERVDSRRRPVQRSST